MTLIQPQPVKSRTITTLERVRVGIALINDAHTLVISAVDTQILGTDEIHLPMDPIFAADLRRKWQDLAARSNGHVAAGEAPLPPDPED